MTRTNNTLVAVVLLAVLAIVVITAVMSQGQQPGLPPAARTPGAQWSAPIPGAQVQTPSPVPTLAPDSLSLIEKDQRAGKLDLDTALRYKAQALFQPDQLPPQYRSTQVIYDGTPVLVEARREWDRLRPETQELIRRYLEDESSISANEGPRLAALWRDTGEWAPPSGLTDEYLSLVPSALVTTTSHFEIKYGKQDAALAQTAAEALEHSYQHIVDQMGYRKPATRADTPQGKKISVRITGFTSLLGACGLGNPLPFGPQIMLSRDTTRCDLQTTCAHEFFHLSQFEYDWNESLWWEEATAMWVEDEVFDAVNDYVGYLGGYFFPYPEAPLFALEPDNHEYGACIYPKFLSEKWDPGIIREIWERCASVDAMEAINAELVEREGTSLIPPGSGIAASFPEFVARNYEGDYRDGQLYGRPRVAQTHSPDPQHPAQGQGTVRSLAAEYTFFRAPASVTGAKTPSTLKIDFRSTKNGANGAVTLIKAKAQGGFERERISLQMEIGSTGDLVTKASIEVQGFGSTYPEVVLAVSNNWPKEEEFAYTYSAQVATGPQAITDTPPSAGTSTVLVVDISGSMGDLHQGKRKIDAARDAALNIIGMIEQESQAGPVSHQVGIATFSTDARLDLPLTNTYVQARDVVNGLGPTNRTNIGAGLKVANEALQKAPAGAKKIIILLSDGMTNEGLGPDAILSGPVQDAVKAGTCIYAVGFGDAGSVDESLLRRIAEATGCKYYYASDAFQLESIYVKVRHESLGKVIGEFSGQVKQDQTVVLGRIDVPASQGTLYASLAWPGSALDLLLTDPQGNRVDSRYPGARLSSSNRLVYLIVENPRPGAWQAAVYGRDVPAPNGEPYHAVFSVRQKPYQQPDNSGLIIVAVVAALAVLFIILLNQNRGIGSAMGLYVADGPLAGRLFPLRRPAFVIGRDPRSHLALPDPHVSARHAQITVSAGGCAIQDLNSTNGTFVNGQRVQLLGLKNGDEIRIGSTRLIFRG